VVNANNKPKKNLGESIRQRLKNLSEVGTDHIEFKGIIEEISVQIKPLIALAGNQ
jgi:hypothetical protein